MTQIGSAKFEIPGVQMYSQEYCDTDAKHLNNHESLFLQWDSVERKKGKQIKVKNKERIFFNTRKCKPAILVVPIYDEVYEYWISNECPYFSNQKEWKKMSDYNRALAHLIHRASDERGVLVDWHVELD